MSDTQSPVPADSPMLLAWNKYKASDRFANTRKWALHDAHVDGSLWAAFVEGYRAATPTVDYPIRGDAGNSGYELQTGSRYTSR